MDIVIAIIGSGALSAAISGLFAVLNRYIDRQNELRNKADEIESLKHTLAKLEKDSVRTQLLLLMTDYPNNEQEIQEVAQHYFVDCKGNWYMTNMYSKWLKDNDYVRPDWFQK